MERKDIKTQARLAKKRRQVDKQLRQAFQSGGVGNNVPALIAKQRELTREIQELSEESLDRTPPPVASGNEKLSEANYRTAGLSGVCPPTRKRCRRRGATA